MPNKPETTKSERLPRGSNPPSVMFTEALAITRSIYEQGGGRASGDVLSKILGNSPNSSSFVRKVGALKNYGLVTEQNGSVMLTECGLTISAPTSDPASAAAKKTAFLNVSIFSKIFERHKAKLLPADEFLVNMVVQECKIPMDLAPEWVTKFKEGSAAAGLLYVRPDGKTQVLDGAPAQISGPEAREVTQSPALSEARESDPPPSYRPVSFASTVSPLSVSGNFTKFELSGGKVASFQIPFGLSNADVKKLTGFLEGLKLIIGAAVSDPDETS